VKMFSSNRISTKQKLPAVFNPDQLVVLFDTIDRPKVGIATALGFYCGLRISEVCKLKVDDVDLVKKRLKVEDSKYTAKDNKSGYGKDRYVPIPDTLISPLKKWIEIIGGGKWLLPSHSSPNSHLSKKTLGLEFRYILNVAKFNQVGYEITFKSGPNKGLNIPRYKYHFHTLRHSYATYLIDKGVDIYTISDLLGHNQVTTTQIYARVSNVLRVKAINEAFNLTMSSRVISTTPNNVGYAGNENNSQDIEILKLQVRNKELEIRKLELLKNNSVPEIEN